VVARFPVGDQGLFLTGSYGVGKSHLAVAILRGVIEKGGRGVFWETTKLLREIRDTYSEQNGRESGVLRPAIEADLLVLDDLGVEKTSEWVEETLHHIVNSRYSAKRLTVFTSNLPLRDDLTDPQSLQVRIGMRMYSRILEMCSVITLEGVDFRNIHRESTDDAIKQQWKNPRPSQKSIPVIPGKSSGQLKARWPAGDAELKWSGGRAGN
jgi:DNA replication protein DnaC